SWWTRSCWGATTGRRHWSRRSRRRAGCPRTWSRCLSGGESRAGDAVLAHPLLEVAAGSALHLLPQQRRPPEQQAHGPEGLARPAVEVEAVAMAEDLPVAELELGVDDVEHLPAAGGEGVARLPVGAAGAVIGLDAAELEGEVLATLTEHAPHGGDAGVAEADEHLIGELRVRVVA